MVYCLDFFMGSECTPLEVRNFTMGSECTHPEVRSFTMGSECTTPEVRDFSVGKTLAMSKPHEIVSANPHQKVPQSGISLAPEPPILPNPNLAEAIALSLYIYIYNRNKSQCFEPYFQEL